MLPRFNSLTTFWYGPLQKGYSLKRIKCGKNIVFYGVFFWLGLENENQVRMLILNEITSYFFHILCMMDHLARANYEVFMWNSPESTPPPCFNLIARYDTNHFRLESRHRGRRKTWEGWGAVSVGGWYNGSKKCRSENVVKWLEVIPLAKVGHLCAPVCVCVAAVNRCQALSSLPA